METQAEYTIVDERTVLDKQSEIIEHHGIDKQLDQLIEECGELIVAISKYKRYIPGGNSIDVSLIHEIVQELGDVKNLIEQLELSSEFIGEGVSKVKEYKVNREIDRISKVK